MTLHEAFCGKPLGFSEGPEKPLYTLLKEFSIPSLSGYPGIAKQIIKNLADFFSPEPFAIISEGRKEDTTGGDPAGEDEQSDEGENAIVCNLRFVRNP